MAPWQRPRGGLYSVTSTIRDFPVNHPFLTAGMLAAGLLLAPPAALIGAGIIYGGSLLTATGMELAAALPQATRALQRIGSRRPDFTAPYVDTRAAYNMRQASLRAIHDSGYLLRNIIGREARLLHR